MTNLRLHIILFFQVKILLCCYSYTLERKTTRNIFNSPVFAVWMRGKCYFYLFMLNNELKYIKRAHCAINTLKRRAPFHSFASANQKFATLSLKALWPAGGHGTVEIICGTPMLESTTLLKERPKRVSAWSGDGCLCARGYEEAGRADVLSLGNFLFFVLFEFWLICTKASLWRTIISLEKPSGQIIKYRSSSRKM